MLLAARTRPAHAHNSGLDKVVAFIETRGMLLCG
jgi:hypothetical protein